MYDHESPFCPKPLQRIGRLQSTFWRMRTDCNGRSKDAHRHCRVRL
jgi:hypothetical protein